mmetsp:Transcript_15155/g.26703  ORF Transcript_15155/g.26703 Transcript_15155/m.26703 type:complete len:560 (-) Transcript_15155:3170-4849(-)|eukprot:CAMPEP_0203749324 /NCGR_PEP_ID=MMETSP0098-20131031/3936_1 /ASSEMBLY_ACC=CAM_ASM_000208 /TAXON_ID=96639 /ORGANISM=" , Strain NY0313808BC1" /LENGTH=559 /DNA_ID=CAMNT_0050638361 /DNA_START=336 /DNA_END=2015 /DNA_ORIENTATION=+
MKFGRRLEEDLQEVGWEEHYVRYRRLKKLIKILGVADEETFDEDYVGSGALERFMNGGEEWEAARSLRCFQCKRCRVFALMIRVDILSVKSFLRETLAVLKATFVGSVQPALDELLNVYKSDDGREEEPTLYPDCPEIKPLAAFAVWVDTLQALRKYVAVNNEALKKIMKKYKKQVFSQTTTPCGPKCASKKFFEENRSRNLYMVNDNRGVLLPIDVFGDMTNCLDTDIELLNELEFMGFSLDTKLMIDCSVFHDFVADHLIQLTHQRVHDKHARVEANKIAITRWSRVIDLENQIVPSAFLAVGVTLPLFTLACTYYISAQIDIGGKGNIFEQQGYFISSSIDRAPASNVGTLGLTTTLMLLSNIVFVKHKLVKKSLRARKWMRTHRIATLVGMLSTFCGNGVAAFQYQFQPAAHNTFAACFFVFGMIHVVLETWLDVYHELSAPTTRRFRLFIAILLILCVLAFLGPMTYVLIYEDSLTPGYVRWLKDVAACFEVIAFACLVAWFSTYYSTLKSSKFALHVHPHVQLERTDLHDIRQSQHFSRFSTKKHAGNHKKTK